MFLDKSSTGVNNNIVVITNITCHQKTELYNQEVVLFPEDTIYPFYLSYFRLTVCNQFKYKRYVFLSSDESDRRVA